MIRKSTANDIDIIMDIWLSTNIKAHSFIPAEYWESHFNEVKAAILEAEVYVYEDTAIKGFVGLIENYIAGIFVKEEFQSQGIGKALIQYLQNCKSELVLNVYEENRKAVDFYTKHNFAISEKKNDEETNHVEYQMIWTREPQDDYIVRSRRKPMRRSDREIKDFDEIIQIMQRCEVCRIALNNHGYPYILPLNFGMKVEHQTVELYFHGANEGTKYDLIKADNRAGFEMDCTYGLVTEMETGNCTMEYESVTGYGHIQILSEEEKDDALSVLMKHYHQETFPYNKAVMPRTTVFKLVVENMTGKARITLKK